MCPTPSRRRLLPPFRKLGEVEDPELQPPRNPTDAKEPPLAPADKPKNAFDLSSHQSVLLAPAQLQMGVPSDDSFSPHVGSPVHAAARTLDLHTAVLHVAPLSWWRK